MTVGSIRNTYSPLLPVSGSQILKPLEFPKCRVIKVSRYANEVTSGPRPRVGAGYQQEPTMWLES